MDNLKIYLLTLTAIHLWVMIFDKKFDGKALQYKNRLIRYIDFKPVNCVLCLSFWTGVILYFWFDDLIYLTLPLITLIQKK